MLALLAWSGPALADTSISDARTTPVATSTANAGAADDVAIVSGGSINLAGGVAVTLDSDNTVANAGAITIEDASDATGVLVTGGHTGSVTNTGTILLDETATLADGDSDGDLDGAFATTARKYGLRLTGGSPFVGAITNSGTISLEGNDSPAISLETILQGSLTQSGALSVTGSRSAGLITAAAVTGDITVNGTVAAAGEGARGVAIGGDVGGGLIIQSTVSATGYRYTSRLTDNSILDADDLLQGGPAVSVAASLGKGLLVDVPPTDADSSNSDEDGDGVTDTSEGSGSVISYGAAPAIQVGATGRDIVLGQVGAGDSAYGVLIKGVVTGSGVYDNIEATGLRLGVAGGGKVTIEGGVENIGTVSAGAYASATAIQLVAGAETPRLYNGGTIAATSTSDGAVSTQALSISQGASLPLLQNSGTIGALLYGESGEAVAVRDFSGSLSRIENTGTISAVITATDSTTDTDDADTAAGNEVISGKAIALDLSANTSGVTIWQYDTSAGVTPPMIRGSVLLGSGADRLDILAGTINGDIAFGAGANTLTLDGGGAIVGAITAQGGTLGLTIGDGALQVQNVGDLNLSGLALSGSSQLILTADPASGSNTRLLVAGNATIADGAKIGLRLTSLLKGAATYTVIQADKLTVGAIDTSLLGETPYLYSSSLSSDASAGTVSLSLSRKSAADLAIPQSVAAAYEPLVEAIDRDSNLRSAILAQTGRTGFMSAYNQLMPDRAGGVFEMAAAGAQAFGAPIDDRQDPEGGGAWVQELNYGAVEDGAADTPGYKAWGLGVVGGYEAHGTPFGVFGLTFGAASSQIKEDGADASEKLVVSSLEAGAYWRATIGAFSASARAAGDYLRMSNDRVVTISADDATLYSGAARGRWSGMAVAARLKASYELHLGSTYFRPQAGLDYFRLAEGDYQESGADAVRLSVDARTSSRLSGFAGAAFGAVFGQDATWGPELLLGYRTVASEQLGVTTARFVSGGGDFSLLADRIGGSGPSARLSLKGEDGVAAFALEGGAELRDGLAIYDLKLSAHLAF